MTASRTAKASLTELVRVLSTHCTITIFLTLPPHRLLPRTLLLCFATAFTDARLAHLPHLVTVMKVEPAKGSAAEMGGVVENLQAQQKCDCIKAHHECHASPNGEMDHGQENEAVLSSEDGTTATRARNDLRQVVVWKGERMCNHQGIHCATTPETSNPPHC